MASQLKHTIIIGLALFALYFGAGNLIFPPTVGHTAGSEWLMAIVGFSITGIVLPLMAVTAVYNSGGTMETLFRPVGKWFYIPFNLILMICIGMLVTMPRMAATTYELGIVKVTPDVPLVVANIVYFLIVFYFCLNKSTIIDKVGKWLTPALVLILVIIVVKGIISPLGTPIVTEQTNTLSTALLSAYQTGDVGTGILVAPIIIAAILAYGYQGASVKKIVFRGIFIAGLCLLFIYGGLLYVGATISGVLPKDLTDIERLSTIVEMSLGSFGIYALAFAIILACLTSTIGIMAIVAEFVNDITKNVFGYKTWVAIISIICATIASFGVAQIVELTFPIFLAVYPIIIALVLLGTFHRFIPNDGAYKGTILLTAIVSIVDTLRTVGIEIPGLTAFIASLPFSASGFSWVVPAIIGFMIGAFIRHKMGVQNSEASRS